MKDLPDPSFVFDPKDKKIASTQHGKKGRGKKRNLDKKTRDTVDPFAPPRKKMRRWKKILLWILAIAVGVGVAFGVYVFLHIAKITSNPFSFTKKLDGEDEGRVNILLLGVGDPGHAGEQLSDTNMVLSLNTNDNTAALISIPRDTEVDIAGHGPDKINVANTLGGVDLARKTVEDTLGIPIHYYVKANFTGLKQVVDTVGGIDVDNKNLLYDSEFPCDYNQYLVCGFKLEPGAQHLDGKTALKYARCRKGTCGDDFGRDARQQEVLQKVSAKALTLDSVINPGKFNALLNSVSNNIKTDLSIANMSRLYDLSKKIDQSKTINVVFSLAPGGMLVGSNVSSNLLPEGGDFSKIQALVKNIFKFGPIYSEKPIVVVENGTKTVGIGGKFNDKITEEEYPITVMAVTNALTRDHTENMIIDFTGGKKPNTATYFENLLDVKTTPADKTMANPSGADFIIILGTNYASSLSSTSANSNN